MRVVIPIHSLERGGGCRVVAEAANGLTARGHHVTVVIPGQAPIAWPLAAEIRRVPHLAADFFPPADVVLPTFYTTLPAALASGIPVVRFCLGFEPLWVPDPEYAAAGYKLPHPVITISRFLQEILMSRVGRHSYLVHPGVDRAAFHPCGNKGAYGSPSVVFLLRGPGYHYKGNAVFWQAMSIVRRKYPGVRLLIVANDEAADPGLGFPYLLLRAPTDAELGRILSAADVFVFSSLFEGFGLPPLEAMACGTAVVCTDSGGVRDYASHGTNCLLVPPGQAESLARAVLDLLRQPVLRQRIAAGGLSTAAVWGWHRLYDGLSGLLPQLVAASS